MRLTDWKLRWRKRSDSGGCSPAGGAESTGDGDAQRPEAYSGAAPGRACLGRLLSSSAPSPFTGPLPSGHPFPPAPFPPAETQGTGLQTRPAEAAWRALQGHVWCVLGTVPLALASPWPTAAAPAPGRRETWPCDPVKRTSVPTAGTATLRAGRSVSEWHTAAEGATCP